MTMDYGDGAAPHPVGRMGAYAIAAARAARDRACSAAITAASDSCSGIAQTRFAFAGALAGKHAG